MVTRTSTVKIRAEEGRHITGVNVSPFLNTLPGGRSTEHFCTKDASGSTSQAAAIIESVEAGAQTLLMDEDTCATNLLVRDRHMRALIPAHSEPITPLVDRIAQMTKTWDVSIIMVVGGMGAYLGVADHVIAMDHFIARDVTTIAKALDIPAPQPSQPLSNICPRVPRAKQWAIRKIRARDKKHITLDKQELDVAAVEQIIDAAHAKTIGHALRFIYEHLINGSRDISQVLNALDAILNDEGVEALAASDRPPGDLIRPRRYEVAAALSRFRQFSVQRKPNP